MEEFMDLVNDSNEVIGVATQKEVYDNKLNHRIVHVFVINPETNEIYFQKRAESKSYLPGYYCTSAGGHVKSGESYYDAAKRELSEELGLDCSIKKIAEIVFVDNNHKRFIELFTAFAESGFNFKDGEVASGEFLDFEKAFYLISKGEKIHPQLDVCFKWVYDNREKILV